MSTFNFVFPARGAVSFLLEGLLFWAGMLPEDLLLLGKESKKYQQDWEWVNQNFDKLHEQMTGDEAVISMGVKIYTCRGESISKGQRGM